MKIVFLNVKARLVEIYSEKGINAVPFSGIHRLQKELKPGEEFLYITNAVKSKSQDLIKMVNSMNINSLNRAIENNEPLYIRSTAKGVIRIESLNLSFNGPEDFKPLDDIFVKFGKNVLDKNLTLKKLREDGRIEVLSQNDIESVQNYLKTEKAKKLEKIKEEEEKRKSKSRGEAGDESDMWSDNNPLALSASGLRRGSTSPTNNEESFITDDLL